VFPARSRCASSGNLKLLMSLSRRNFLTSAGAALLAPAIPQTMQGGSNESTQVMKLEITPAGSQPSAKGPADWFTGVVRIDPLFQPVAPARTSAASVTFEPGARTVWHTHPLGQRLVITSGLGWVQEDGGPVREVRPGDVVWIPPQVRHWHGAAPATAMTHIAIQEALDGEVVQWQEKVSDEQYRKP
jgi:quercetin dioxygenase-like cupin family protein